MRTDGQIQAEGRQAGQVELAKLQLEVLLDIRTLLARLPVAGMSVTEATGHLKTLAERWRKPGRPRKKRASQSPGQ